MKNTLSFNPWYVFVMIFFSDIVKIITFQTWGSISYWYALIMLGIIFWIQIIIGEQYLQRYYIIAIIFHLMVFLTFAARIKRYYICFNYFIFWNERKQLFYKQNKLYLWIKNYMWNVLPNNSRHCQIRNKSSGYTWTPNFIIQALIQSSFETIATWIEMARRKIKLKTAFDAYFLHWLAPT